MNWHYLDPGHAVLELDLAIVDHHRVSRRNGGFSGKTPQFGDRVIRAASPPPLELELHVYWGGGEPSRAVWLWSQTGRVAGWAAVGEA
jgi:hypothetical protein